MTHYCNTTNYKTAQNNWPITLFINELEALGAAGAIQTIKLNPYQTLLSGYDGNNDGVINGSDNISNYLYIQTNADQSVTLYLPDNAQARAMIAGYTGGESIQTAQGEKIIKSIQFYAGYSMDLNIKIANNLIQKKAA